jgi:hypothetical protein
MERLLQASASHKLSRLWTPAENDRAADLQYISIRGGFATDRRLSGSRMHHRQVPRGCDSRIDSRTGGGVHLVTGGKLRSGRDRRGLGCLERETETPLLQLQHPIRDRPGRDTWHGPVHVADDCSSGSACPEVDEGTSSLPQSPFSCRQACVVRGADDIPALSPDVLVGQQRDECLPIASFAAPKSSRGTTRTWKGPGSGYDGQ